AAMVLGLGFEGLCAGVSRHWGLPDSLQRCMRRPDVPSPAQIVPYGPERMRWMSVAANELADAVWQADEGHLGARLEAVLSRHGRALGLGQIDVRRAVETARQSLAEMAPAMGLLLPEGSRGQRVLDQAVPAPAPVDMADTLTPHQLAATVHTIAMDDQATLRLPSGARGAAHGGEVVVLDAGAASSAQVADALAAGIQDITDTLAGDSFKLNEVLR
ncbi:MAG: serine/threonine protein kinase, partial [Burkholderiales bacterium PBB5]